MMSVSQEWRIDRADGGRGLGRCSSYPQWFSDISLLVLFDTVGGYVAGEWRTRPDHGGPEPASTPPFCG